MQELWCQGPNSWRIFARRWPVKEARHFVLGVHGYSEHSGSYDHLAKFLQDNGVESVFLDLPGHGQSDGRASNIDRFDDYLKSVSAVIQAAEVPNNSILLGHSLGGLVSLRYSQVGTERDRFDRLVLLSPLLGLASGSYHGLGEIVQSELGLRALELFCVLAPNLNLPNRGGMEASILTHDVEMARRRAEDPLVRDSVTVNWTREFLKARRYAEQDLDKIQAEVAIFQAGDDRVVSRGRVEALAKKLGAKLKLFKVYEGLYHELVNETGRAQVFEDVLQSFRSEGRMGST